MFESIAFPTAARNPDLHAGGLVVPMVGEKPRLNKPPMIYWLQSSSSALLTGGQPEHDRIWMYRLPSLIAGIGIVLITFQLGLWMFEPRVGLLAGALIALSPVFVWEAHQARADMVMVLFTTLALALLYRIWQRQDRSWFLAIGFWICVSLGILTKGPITPMILILTTLSISFVCRDFRWLGRTKPVIGLFIVLLLVLPWVVLVALRVGFENYASLVFDETLGRSASAKEGHAGPPGYHLILLVVLFWPGSMLAGAAVLQQFSTALPRKVSVIADKLRPRRIWQAIVHRTPGEPQALFLIAWVVPSWIIFEIVRTKLPHYTMPLYPAIALLTAKSLVDLTRARWSLSRLERTGLWFWLVLCAVIAASPMILNSVLRSQNTAPSIDPVLIAGLVILVGLFVVVSRAIFHQNLMRAQLASLAIAWLTSITLLGRVLPNAEMIWVTPGLMQAIEKIDPEHTRPIAAIEYHEDSLVFATRSRLSRINADQLGAWSVQNPAGLIIQPYHEDLIDPETFIARITGYNYSRGRRVDLAIQTTTKP